VRGSIQAHTFQCNLSIPQLVREAEVTCGVMREPAIVRDDDIGTSGCDT
jgi:hypothetical protein